MEDAEFDKLIQPLLTSKEMCFIRLQNLFEMSKTVSTDASIEALFIARAQDLPKIRDEFDKSVAGITSLNRQYDPKYKPTYKEIAAFDDIYYMIRTVADTFTSKVVSVKSEHNVNKNENSDGDFRRVKLPELQLFKFDGKIENWPTFRDTFLSLIHNNSRITQIEKYYYLLSCVSGPALSIVKSMPVSADNYAIVWKSLEKRYENKRVLATAYLDKLFGFKPIISESASNLNTFLNTYQENISALELLNISDLSSFILFYVSLRNLDAVTRREFEQTVSPGHIPTITELLTFVESQVRVLEMSECKPVPVKPSAPGKLNTAKSPSPAASKAPNLNKSRAQAHTLASAVASTDKSESKSSISCLYCQKPQHSIYRCTEYNELTPELREAKVAELKLCANCLRNNHATEDCTSKHCCTVCKKRHHVTLHIDSTKSEEKVVALTCSTEETVLLGTAVIHVADAWSQYHPVRVIIDSGAMSSYITKDCVGRLGLSRRKCNFEPIGIGGNRVQHYGLTTCTIKPRDTKAPVLATDAVVVANIAGNLPTMPMPDKIFSDYQHLVLADPAFNKPAPVEMLIASDLFPYIYGGDKILPSQPGMPVAIESIFGYVITGQVVLDQRNPRPTMTSATLASSDNSFCGLTSSTNLDQIMNAFWDTENIPSEKPMKPDDALAEELFARDCRRDETGRFVVKYPLRPDHNLGESRQVAVRRLVNLEAKLNREPGLKLEYHKFMSEYEALGHMTCLGEMQDVDSKYLIPHFCIHKPSSTTTKLRTVFDASCKTTNQKSLNDVVLAGPKLQADINNILINFRLHEVCLSADICKMYRQILIHQEQRPYQHILWRVSTDQPMQVYELNTVTYGVASSPYLAIKVLHTLADAEADKYPAAARVLKTAFFMDDLLWSEPNVDVALQLQSDLRAILERAGFILRKWSSNCPQLLAAVPEDHRETPIEFDDDENLSLKVLGLQWQPATDCFSFRTAPLDQEVTKRSILSQIGRLFDPLGFVAPCVFYAKCFMQKLWALQLHWDQRLPANLEAEWLAYVRELPLLSEFKHDRHAMVRQSTCCRILGFCDASTLGYAAVIYLYTTNNQNEQKVSLITAKSKVAPLKTLSVPRLELMAAHLLSKLVKYVKNILAERNITIDEILLFTDSSVVLAWLNTPAYKLKIFVATRVTKILDTVPSTCWFHVSGVSNPADVCSRGALPSTLLTMPEWLNGPQWLSDDNWPVRSIEGFRDDHPPELKPSIESKSLVSVEAPSDIIYELTERYSSFNKLLHVVARICQFIRNCRLPKDERTGLRIVDLRNAHNSLIKSVQQHHFAEDITALSNGLKPHQNLRKLSPFLDANKFLRVGGRLSQCRITYDKKHPVLLPKKCNFTYILIDYYHILYLHSGPRSLQGIISQKYWIISARSVIRSRTSKCIACFKVRPKSWQPIMGQLPKYRTQDIHTFHTVGVDIGGPFHTKESTRRNTRTVKSYLCVFVCCATRAVHLETLSSLSTECFFASFDRFTARRGLCSAVISDNGTNFVAAGKQLAEASQFFEANTDEISCNFTTRKVTWKHNPPTGSHFGGIYEAAIKSAKTHLKRTVGERALTFEELTTLFTRVEAALNSRPLCALSSDPSEFEVLTPAHFLIGRELLEAPEYDLTSSPLSKLNRWQAVQQMSQQFWRLWRKDYLHTLQQRQKWLDGCRNLKEGDLVLINSEAPPLQWALGRVIKLYPGPDGIVRVVGLRTKNNVITRPVVKISPLPLEQEST